MLCSFHKNGPEIEFSEIAKIWLDKFRKMKYNNSRKSRHATVAQLVEQLIRNQQVAGSSPATSSINRAGFRLVILRGLFLCFLYKNSSALLFFHNRALVLLIILSFFPFRVRLLQRCFSFGAGVLRSPRG